MVLFAFFPMNALLSTPDADGGASHMVGNDPGLSRFILRLACVRFCECRRRRTRGREVAVVLLRKARSPYLRKSSPNNDVKSLQLPQAKSEVICTSFDTTRGAAKVKLSERDLNENPSRMKSFMTNYLLSVHRFVRHHECRTASLDHASARTRRVRTDNSSLRT